MTRNKRAGENSTTKPMGMLSALILVVLVIIIYYSTLGELSKGMDDSRRRGFCNSIMKTRHVINPLKLVDLGKYDPWDPRVGPAITGARLFYVSPACGNMYDAPCDSVSDCQNKTFESIKDCRKMQQAEPETARPCLTDLEINATVGAADLCKNNTNICGNGAECSSAVFGATGINNGMINYEKCPQTGASISIKYDKSSITVMCQGTCNTP